jgi:hypothetical protein
VFPEVRGTHQADDRTVAVASRPVNDFARHEPLHSEHAVWIRAGNTRREPRSGVVWITDDLQRVPVLDRFPIGVHLEDVDAGDPRVKRVVVEAAVGAWRRREPSV